MKTKSEITKYLKKELNYELEEDGEDIYTSDHVCVSHNTKTNQLDISFAHNADGYFEIKNASLDKIKTIISLLNEAEEIDTSEDENKFPTFFYRKMTDEFMSFMKNKINKQK